LGERSSRGLVPAGARLVELTLSVQGAATANCGVADNLSLVLNLATNQPITILSSSLTNGAAQVVFECPLDGTAWLERSEDFSQWTALPGTVAGLGPLTLVDTNPPPSQAFYRVGLR
jgi:hypothetical protein